MTGTTADRTTSSTRGLQRPEFPSPAKYQPVGNTDTIRNQGLSRLPSHVWDWEDRWRIMMKLYPAALLEEPVRAGVGWWLHGNIVLSPPCPEPALLSSEGCDTPAPPPPLRNRRYLNTTRHFCVIHAFFYLVLLSFLKPETTDWRVIITMHWVSSERFALQY